MPKHPPALTDNEVTRLYITMENSTASVREIEQAVIEALHQSGRLVSTTPGVELPAILKRRAA